MIYHDKSGIQSVDLKQFCNKILHEGVDMLTSVQKEILQTLINLYQNSDSKSIKGESIAEVMNRNPGTIRNQMQSLRSLGLVKGVPGPRGGYKPTIEAYHTLNISFTDSSANVPIFKKLIILIKISLSSSSFSIHISYCLLQFSYSFICSSNLFIFSFVF